MRLGVSEIRTRRSRHPILHHLEIAATVRRAFGNFRKDMTAQPRPSGLGYESPTEQTVASALAANHLIYRLNELHTDSTTGDDASQRRQPATVDELVSKVERGSHSVSIKDRIACFRWTWFTSTMATGGIANVIASSESSRPWFTSEVW